MAVVYECPAEFLPAAGRIRSVFLAGGITGCPDWQAEFVGLLGGYRCHAVLLNPRRKDFPIGDPSAARGQIHWEFRHLRKASAVLFWFPGQTLCPIALYELGAWSMTGKPLFVGCDPGYARRADVIEQTLLARPGVAVASSLVELARQTASWAMSEA